MADAHGIVLYEPEELIVVTHGDISLLELENTLSESGQWIPTLTAAEHPATTLSEAVEQDYYHPRAASCGMLRTSILGGSFISKSGGKFKSGSRVVKSVAGYDIHRAFCGSKGKFGTIETLTLKVQAMPQMFFHFHAPLSSLSIIQQCYPTIVEEHDGRLFIELAGYMEDIEHDRERIRTLAIEEINRDSASQIIKEIIESKTKKDTINNDSDLLITHLISAFETSGVKE